MQGRKKEAVGELMIVCQVCILHKCAELCEAQKPCSNNENHVQKIGIHMLFEHGFCIHWNKHVSSFLLVSASFHVC